MADIEKVIKGLEFCTSTTGCEGCPYEDPCHDIEQRILGEAIMRDALELLKEQHPIKPEIFGNNCWCGKCDDYIMTAKQTRTPMNRSKIKFCCHCGQAIDWQEFEKDGEQ